jgi:hypothetical protein
MADRQGKILSMWQRCHSETVASAQRCGDPTHQRGVSSGSRRPALSLGSTRFSSGAVALDQRGFAVLAAARALVLITSSLFLSSLSSGTKPLPPHLGHCTSSSVPFSTTPSPLQSGQVFMSTSRAGRKAADAQNQRPLRLPSGHYQCACSSASTVASPAIIEPAVAIAAGIPSGNSRLITAATNIAATGRAMTK